MAVVSLKYKSKQGTLTAPGDVDPGAMIPIATTTLSTSGANVTFSNIPQEYEHLQIRGIGRQTSTNSYALMMRFNSDTGSNYSSHRLDGNGSSASANADTSVSAMYSNVMLPLSSAGANTFGAIVFDILDYANTNKYKTVRALFGFDNNGSGQVGLGSGSWRSTSAVTSIQLVPQFDNLAQYTSFALYGIKRAGA
jgi:hypothetical protein